MFVGNLRGRQYAPHAVVASHTTMLEEHDIFEDGISFCTLLAGFQSMEVLARDLDSIR